MIDQVRAIVADGPAAALPPKDVPPAQRFYVISGQWGVRWIVPVDPAAGWPALRQWRPYGLSSLAKWRTLTLAYRSGLLDALPGIRVVGLPGALPLATGHHDVSNTVPSIYVGTPGRHRKLVVTLVRRRTARAVAKLPLGADSTRIVHEGRMLKWLDEHRPGRAPQLLHLDERQGVSVQTAVRGTPTNRAFGPQHAAFLRHLVVERDEISLHDARTAMLATLAGTADCTAQDRGFLASALAEIPAGHVPAAIVQGDFAPWNALEQGGELLLLDWESAAQRGLPVQDALHFFAVQAYVFHRRRLFTPRVAATLQRVLATANVPRRYVAAVMRLALAQEWLLAKDEGDAPRARHVLNCIATELPQLS
jgi:hypothetical protein